MAAASDPEDDAELGELENEEVVTEQMNGTDNEGDVGHENDNSSIYENPSEGETPRDNLTAIELNPNRLQAAESDGCQAENFDETTLAEIHAVPQTAETDCSGKGVINATNDSNWEFDEDCVDGDTQLAEQEQSVAMNGILQPTQDDYTDEERDAENSSMGGEDNLWEGGDTAGEKQEQGFVEEDENNEDGRSGDESKDKKDSGDENDEDDAEEDEDYDEEDDDEETNDNELITNDLNIDFPAHCRYFLF